jgi:hypothetical protein
MATVIIEPENISRIMVSFSVSGFPNAKPAVTVAGLALWRQRSRNAHTNEQITFTILDPGSGEIKNRVELPYPNVGRCALAFKVLTSPPSAAGP